MNKNAACKAGKRRLGALAVLCVSCLLMAGCPSIPRSEAPKGQGCGWHMAVTGEQAPVLGPNDLHANYMGFIFPVKEGRTLVVKAPFPHARYIAFVLYDQDFRLIDWIPDYEIVPSRGQNPFRAGVKRSGKELGEYELRVVSKSRPEQNREQNTLYAGKDHKGRPNRVAVLAYRVYLPDKGYAAEDGHPLGVFGGVDPGSISLIDAKGKLICPGKAEVSLCRGRISSSIIAANFLNFLRPGKFAGGPHNPPLWVNYASEQGDPDRSFIPNAETAYIAAAISRKHGDYLVLRWKAAETPRQTWLGEPFPENYDMRYFSLTFAAIDRSLPMPLHTEKTLADVEIPALPDGTSQLVVGLGGANKPSFVAPEQWVGLKMNEGIIVMRNIQIREGYKGDFRKMPPGPISAENDKFTPGGVYCSEKELADNPDLGLKRAELLKQIQ